jgi:ABC-type bacteriocin/lantibiotic exporter with double-glycine peptidase domain
MWLGYQRRVFSSAGEAPPTPAAYSAAMPTDIPPDGAKRERDDAASASRSKKPSTWASFKRTTRFASVAQREIVYGLLFLPAALSSTLALPFFVGNIIDSVVGPLAEVSSIPVEGLGGLTRLQATVSALLGISVFGALASTARSYYINLAAEIIVRHLRTDLFADVLRKEVEFFDRNKTGDLMNRLSADATLIGSVLTESVSMALRSVGTLTLGTAFLFYTSWELALVSTASLVPMLLLSRVYGDFIKRRTKEQLQVFGAASSVAEEFISNVRSTLIFNRQAHAAQRYAEQVDAAFAIGRDVAFRRGLFMGSTNFVVSMSILAALGYGSMMVAKGALSPGQLTSFLLYSVTVAGASFQVTVRRRAWIAHQAVVVVDEWVGREVRVSGRVT